MSNYKGFPVIATDLTVISSLFSFFHIHPYAGFQLRCEKVKDC